MSGKTQKRGWLKGLGAEFKKIIWPDKMALVKGTAAVIAVSVALGAVIAVLDFVIRQGVDILVTLG